MKYKELVNKAVKLTKNKDYSEAMLTVREAIALDPEFPVAYNLLAAIYESLGDRMRAAKFYRVSYFVDQTYKTADRNLSRINSLNHYSSKIELV